MHLLLQTLALPYSINRKYMNSVRGYTTLYAECTKESDSSICVCLMRCVQRAMTDANEFLCNCHDLHVTVDFVIVCGFGSADKIAAAPPPHYAWAFLDR